jgi:sortase A
VRNLSVRNVSEVNPMRARRVRRLFSYLLISGGALLLFLGARDVVDSRLGQSEAEREFQASPAFKPSPFTRPFSTKSTPAPFSASPQLGDPVARLTIPRLAADLYVVEGDGARQLRRGPGHVRGTAMPGANGNCIIAGHRDTHFRVLKDIRRGDEVVLQTRDGEYTYRVVTTQIVSPRDTQSLRPSQDAELHLVTCYPFYYLGSAPKRFIVDAQLENGPSVALPSRFIPSAAPVRSPRPHS